MMTLNRPLKLVLALLLLSLAPIMAQPNPCFIGDDGFNVGCCNIPQVNLPQFPQLQMTGRWGCFRECNLENDYLVNVNFGAPIFVLCDYALLPVTVFPASPGAPGWTGTLLAKYSRTWVEVGGPGVGPAPKWRFLLNGDLMPATPSALSPNQIPCPYPPSVMSSATGAPRPIHVVGHIDYICDVNATGTVGFRARASLGKLEGCITHAAWTERPLPPALAANDRSYFLVAPASFTWVNSAEPGGMLNGEAVRTSSLNLPPVAGAPLYQCHGEAPVVQGNLNTAFADCLCNNSPVSGSRWKHQNLIGVTVCNGVTKTFNSLPVPGSFLPTGLACFTVGRWAPSTPNGDPEHLHVYFGVMLYDVDCSTNNLPFHFVTGVGTTCLFGHPWDPATGGPNPMISSGMYVDLQNCQKATATGLAPTFGAPFLSTVVWNLNMP